MHIKKSNNYKYLYLYNNGNKDIRYTLDDTEPTDKIGFALHPGDAVRIEKDVNVTDGDLLIHEADFLTKF